ncbi:glucosamine-6-phosphate deaminase [Candidatus Malacoplasma girerdii]|uniref:Glucosamine-6-phosphate deaminase n=1 Tax=Candidatus Malacoplasma girerdii TaxID=1318617 RepID=A0A097SS82_9BACT|nr:glucosamine-6-phosphate deaminase [Candidatus Malacoplasma girerdii]
MKIIKVKDYQEMSIAGAKIIKEEILKKPNLTICFATGSTPIGMYQALTKMYQHKELDFSKVTSFNLDEYVGLGQSNPCSYHYFMYKNLFNHININKNNVHLPNGIGDIAKNASDYEKLIASKGGIDFMILGLGTNGHIAFNEPGSKIDESTREIKLTQSTIDANKIYFDNENDIPKTAISMGVGSIMKAKKIILLANGIKKADAIHNMIEGPVTSNCPASFLQKHHDVTVIIDTEAASKLKNS